MFGKIKSIAGVFARGCAGGWRGLAGAALLVFSAYLFVGFFTGVANIKNYIANRYELGTADARLYAAKNRLDRTSRHIRLLSEQSKDFVSEMALRHLNMGDPEMRIIKK